MAVDIHFHASASMEQKATIESGYTGQAQGDWRGEGVHGVKGQQSSEAMGQARRSPGKLVLHKELGWPGSDLAGPQQAP